MEAQTGSRDAFSALCQHFYPGAISFAVKLCGDVHLAEDAVHNALLRLSKTVNKLRDPGAINTWVFKLVRWQVLDMSKQQKRYQPMVETAFFFSDDKFEDRDLAKAIAKLPSIEGQVIHLFYLEEFSLKDIAKVLEIPHGTVKSRLFRARERLKQLLEQDC
ncbi:RNA polymerase sigma factor [uncultured Shewanella sp.]|uniref:RNA polymerase sigma factor n=1 Tax=uncultured Shewanella sp. TaxID=173975 RepID=UPI00261C5681|nr:RNA polymerase sigma factor [uncultured Shewanella sp.]